MRPNQMGVALGSLRQVGIALPSRRLGRILLREGRSRTGETDSHFGYGGLPESSIQASVSRPETGEGRLRADLSRR